VAEASIKIVKAVMFIGIVIVIRSEVLASDMLIGLNIVVDRFVLLSLVFFAQLLLMRNLLLHVALVLFLSVVEVFLFVGHLLLILDSFFLSLFTLLEFSAGLLSSISLSTSHPRSVSSWFVFKFFILIIMMVRPLMKRIFSIFMIFTMDRFVVDRLVDKSVVILIFVVDNPLKSLIVRARSLFVYGSLFIDRLLLDRFLLDRLLLDRFLLDRLRLRSSFIYVSTMLISISVFVASVVVLWFPVVHRLSIVPTFLFEVVVVTVVGFGSVGSGFAFLLHLVRVNDGRVSQEFGH